MATEIFAKIGDIKGESLDSKHKDEIDVLSFAWGVSNPGPTSTGGGSGVGKPTFQDLTIVHGIDNATPALLLACATGRRINEATISHRKAGPNQQDYLIVKLSEVTITSVGQTGAGGPPVRRVGHLEIHQGRPALPPAETRRFAGRRTALQIST